MTGILFFDLETTGLPLSRNAHWSKLENWPRIVSIAWIARDKDGSGEEAHHVIRPEGFVIPNSATAIHGISTDYATRQGSAWREISETLLKVIKAKNIELLVSHNIEFDLPILLSELLRLKIDNTLHNLSSYCTMKGYGSTVGKPFVKLEEAYFALTGSKLEGAHNALNDVRACAICYDRLRSLRQNAIFPSSKSEDDQELIDRILSWADTKPFFDTSTVESIQSSLLRRSQLTDRQRSALENIIDRFRIS